MTRVALQNVTKIFPNGTVAVDNVSLDVGESELVVLLGPSGCGKSTLLRVVAGLEDPTAGSVLLNGEPTDDLAPWERGVAMVFQSYALYPHMSVAENIDFPLKLSGLDPTEREERTRGAASVLGITHLLGRRPANLSGGQRQRVAMGRAVVREPGLLLLDEPLSNIDAGLRAQLRCEIAGLARQLGASMIYVTHDQTEALSMADRLAVMRNGGLEGVGTPLDVYNRPATTYMATFLGTPRMNLLEAVVQVHSDSHIAIVIGEQVLHLRWTDPRARIVSRYHGERIIVGMRAEALTPVAPDTPGDVLTGYVRSIEHHGHETVTFLDVGATSAERDEPAPPVPVSASAGNGSPGRAMGRLVSLFNGRSDAATATAPPSPGHGRHHRRPAEVAVRLAPYPPLRPDDPLSVSVDVNALHFFDRRGNRIDVGPR